MPRLLHRERALLALLCAVGSEVEDLRFQRLLFAYSLRCRERGLKAPYDFVVRPHGPRSYTAAADRERLARRGFLKPAVWNLTNEGRRVALLLANRDAAIFVASRQNGSGTVRRGRGLQAAPTEQATPTKNGPGRGAGLGGGGRSTPTTGALPAGLLATIGYEGRNYEAYFNELLDHRVTRLCDVRRNPLSRKWGFSKGLLSRGCGELGIRYESLPELGIASRKRTGLGDRAAYDRLFAEYESTTLLERQDSVARIARWVDGGERVALTCFERSSRDCHRSPLAEAVVRTAGTALEPRHL